MIVPSQDLKASCWCLSVRLYHCWPLAVSPATSRVSRRCFCLVVCLSPCPSEGLSWSRCLKVVWTTTEPLKTAGSEVVSRPPCTASSPARWGLKHIPGDTQKHASRGLCQKAWVAGPGLSHLRADPSHTYTHVRGTCPCPSPRPQCR